MIYFIAAPPRSGTSMIANLLHQHGAWTGRTIAGDEHNKRGYFENVDLVRVTKQIMKRNGYRARADTQLFVTWENVDRFDPLSLRKRVGNIVGEHDSWLYKDAKLLHLYPLFAKAFPKAIWILPNRDSENIFVSISRHKTWQNREKEWKGTKKEFWQGIKDMISKQKARQSEIMVRSPHITVSPDFLVQDSDYAERFIDWCGLNFDRHAYDKGIDKRIWSG